MHHCVIKMSSMEADTENSNMKQACLRRSGQKWNHRLYLSAQRTEDGSRRLRASCQHRYIVRHPAGEKKAGLLLTGSVQVVCLLSLIWSLRSALQPQPLNKQCLQFCQKDYSACRALYHTPSLSVIKHVNGRLVTAAAIVESTEKKERERETTHHTICELLKRRRSLLSFNSSLRPLTLSDWTPFCSKSAQQSERLRKGFYTYSSSPENKRLNLLRHSALWH